MFYGIQFVPFWFLCFACLVFIGSWIYRERVWTWKNVGFGLLFVVLITGEGLDLYFWPDRYGGVSVPTMFVLYESGFQFVFGTMVLALLYFNYRYDREQAEKETALEELERSVEQKEILVNEIHHRVKNNLQVMLSLIRLRRRKQTNSKFKRQLTKLETKILSIARIHETLYQQEGQTYAHTDDFFRELIQDITDLYDNNEESLDCRIDQFKLEMGQAISCGIVLSELIFNAFEHANKDNGDGTMVTVDITLDEDRTVSITVQDNGTDNLDEEAFYASDTLGHQIVRNITETQLDGEVELSNGQLNRIEIQFPLKEP